MIAHVTTGQSYLRTTVGVAYSRAPKLELILMAERGGCELSGDNGTLSSRRRRARVNSAEDRGQVKAPTKQSPTSLPLFPLLLILFSSTLP